MKQKDDMEPKFRREVKAWLESFMKNEDPGVIMGLVNQISHLHYKDYKKASGLGFIFGILFTLLVLKYLG
jgi:hypothetical protein